jgi:hypothetical protein
VSPEGGSEVALPFLQWLKVRKQFSIPKQVPLLNSTRTSDAAEEIRVCKLSRRRCRNTKQEQGMGESNEKSYVKLREQSHVWWREARRLLVLLS